MSYPMVDKLLYSVPSNTICPVIWLGLKKCLCFVMDIDTVIVSFESKSETATDSYSIFWGKRYKSEKTIIVSMTIVIIDVAIFGVFAVRFNFIS